MAATGRVGISRLVLYRRERAVMLVPRDRGIVLWTLRYGAAVRDPAHHFGGRKDAQIAPKMKSLVTRLIEERSRPWDPSLVRNPVQEWRLERIAEKQRGRTRAAPK